MNRFVQVDGLGLVDPQTRLGDLDANFSGLPGYEDLRPYSRELGRLPLPDELRKMSATPAPVIRREITSLVDKVFPLQKGKEKQSGRAYRSRRWLTMFLKSLPKNKFPKTPKATRVTMGSFYKKRDELRAQAKALVDAEHPHIPGDKQRSEWRKREVDNKLDQLFSHLGKDGCVAYDH